MLTPTPHPNFASRLLARLLPLAGTRSRRGAWLLSLAFSACAIAFQALCTPSTNVVLLYLILTAQTVWFLGETPGMAVTIGAVLIGTIAAQLARAHELGGFTLVDAWNTGSRLLSVGLLGFVLAGLRRSLEVERWRASTDQLTGALNKTAFEEGLDAVIARAAKDGASVVLAYMDLDGFKAVNDRFGHAAGNDVLRGFAGEATRAMRTTDVFGRMGGDEFAAVLRVPSCLEGHLVAELLHRRLGKILDRTGYPVTCSMGALVMEGARMQVEEGIVEQADRLMYVAKDGGKNRLQTGHGHSVEQALHGIAAAPAPCATQSRAAIEPEMRLRRHG